VEEIAQAVHKSILSRGEPEGKGMRQAASLLAWKTSSENKKMLLATNPEKKF